MPTVVLSPIGGAAQQFFDNNGNVLSGGKMYTYAAGTTTPAVTYTTSAGTIANSNPIVLNSAGRAPYEIWLIYQTAYKLVLKDANDVLIYTWDNVSNDYVFPAILPIASGQNLTALNATQITSGQIPSWARLPFTPIAATEKGAASGVATLDGSGGLAQTPGTNTVTTAALQANAVTKVNSVTISPASPLSSTSTSFVDITGLTMSVTTTGGDLVCSITGGPAKAGVNLGDFPIVAINVNGTDYPVGVPSVGTGSTATGSSISGQVVVTGLAAGTYTVKGRYKSANGVSVSVLSTTPAYAQLTCVEYKR
jgi:hypothetical protein